MTRKLSISLPDDVAAELDNVDNVSGYVTEALRSYRRVRQVRELFAHVPGAFSDPERSRRVRARLRAAQQAARSQPALQVGA